MQGAVLVQLQQFGRRNRVSVQDLPVDVAAGVDNLMVHIRAGKVGAQHTEGDRQKEQRLKLLDDRKVEQEEGNCDHNQHFPVAALRKLIETGLLREIQNSFHTLQLSFHTVLGVLLPISQPITHSVSPGLTVAPF